MDIRDSVKLVKVVHRLENCPGVGFGGVSTVICHCVKLLWTFTEFMCVGWCMGWVLAPLFTLSRCPCSPFLYKVGCNFWSLHQNHVSMLCSSVVWALHFIGREREGWRRHIFVLMSFCSHHYFDIKLEHYISLVLPRTGLMYFYQNSVNVKKKSWESTFLQVDFLAPALSYCCYLFELPTNCSFNKSIAFALTI